jgi:hypothetical protein
MKNTLIIVTIVALNVAATAVLARVGISYTPYRTFAGRGDPYQPPAVQKYLVTVSEVEVNIAKRGAGSP